ncbi:MAG: TonB-dependent receptor [Flammeovirgaceae bacterium]|nr:TonB-dependent receptor [Flammeovirgaceae bacterium]
MMKKLLGTMVILVWCCLLSVSANAQTTISGKVVDDTDFPLPGVSVLIKGSTQGTVTDVNGDYQLNVPSDETVLVYSFIGMQAQEIPVGNQSVINVELLPDALEINEVVVVGYGTQKKANLSGAVDQLDPKTIENRPISNLAQGLQGTVPNLNIDFLSGEPGEAANINIRGITSINGGDPLILIDGVPSDALELNRISPQDVEKISVLKDASSAAIYGARAAYGVIIITTKKGRGDRMQISYANNFSWDKPTILPEKITDPYIFSRVLETSTDNTPWDNVNYSDEFYKWAKERSDNPSGSQGVRLNPNDDSQYEYMGNQDWTQYFLDDYAVSQNHQLALSGASEKADFYLSGNYNKQNGALKIADDYFDRFSVRSKVNFSPTKWFTLGNNTFLTSTQRVKPQGLSIWELYNFFPTSWDKNPDGTWANSAVGIEAAQLTEGGNYKEDYNSLQSQFTTQFSFWDDVFRVNADFTYRRGAFNTKEDTKKYKVGYGPEDIREVGSNWARRASEYQNYYVFNAYATFNKYFGKHYVTAIAGYNQENYRQDWTSSSRSNVISPSLPSIQLATGDMQVEEYIREWAIRGAFYRLNYIFNDKYIVEFNGRYDGSSKFPQDKRFGFFPSASLAWRVDQESFFQPLSPAISSFKLRASYGSLGNQSGVDEYGYIPTMAAEQSRIMYDDERPLMVTPPGLVSDNYTWEEVSTLNFGVDFGFFQNKVSATFDIYERNTIGMLIPGKELPGVLGASEPKENAGDLQTKGWELSVAYINQFTLGSKPLNVNARFILSDNKSTITKFDNPNKNLTQFYEGMEMGEIWGLQSDGFFQSEDEIANLDESSLIPWGALNIVPGWPKYQDLNNDGVIEKGLTLDDTKDLSKIGNFAPRMRYGLNLGADWNGFDFSIFFQGLGKKDYYPLDYLYWGFYQQPYAGGYAHTLDFYRPTADNEVERAKHSQAYINAGLADQNLNAEYPILQSWLADRNLGETIAENKGLAIPQTNYLLNAAYLRLKNLTIGYSLPQLLSEKIHVQRLRIYVSGENLAEWSAIKKYFDPEAINDNINYNPGANPEYREDGKGYAYPYMRRYAIGLNVTF